MSKLRKVTLDQLVKIHTLRPHFLVEKLALMANDGEYSTTPDYKRKLNGSLFSTEVLTPYAPNAQDRRIDYRLPQFKPSRSTIESWFPRPDNFIVMTMTLVGVHTLKYTEINGTRFLLIGADKVRYEFGHPSLEGRAGYEVKNAYISMPDTFAKQLDENPENNKNMIISAYQHKQLEYIRKY